MSDRGDQTGEAVKERVEVQKQEPTLYKVVLLNDDYTTMEFVVSVLETVFQKSSAEAHRIMMQVHVNGGGTSTPISTSPSSDSNAARRASRSRPPRSGACCRPRCCTCRVPSALKFRPATSSPPSCSSRRPTRHNCSPHKASRASTSSNTSRTA